MPRVLSYDEAAGRAGVVRRTIERLIAIGEGPAVEKISARRRGILEDDFTAWLRSRRFPTASPTGDTPAPRKPGRPRKTPAGNVEAA